MEKNSQKNSFIENLHLDLALTLTVSHSTTFLSSCFCEDQAFIELIHQGKYVAGLKTDLQFVRKCFFRVGLVATVLELDNL